MMNDAPVDITKEPFKSMLGLFWKDKCCVCGRKIHHSGETWVISNGSTKNVS